MNQQIHWQHFDQIALTKKSNISKTAAICALSEGELRNKNMRILQAVCLLKENKTNE